MAINDTIIRQRNDAIGAALPRILSGNVLVALSAFVVLAAASKAMPLTEFAELSLLMSAAMVGSCVLDFGLNTTVVKQFSASQDEAFLHGVVILKGIVFALSILASALMVAGGLPLVWGVVAVCAGAMNLWTGLRACEQGRQNFHAYARSNALFSLARLVFGMTAILIGSWILVGLALWVAPVIAIALLKCADIRNTNWPEARRVFSQIAAYSWIVYFSSLAFAVLPYLPLFFAKERLTTADVAAFGMVLVILGPVGILVSSVRGYALPMLVSGREGTLLSASRTALVLTGLAAFLAAGFFVLEALYAQTLPQLAEVFLVYAGLYSLTALLGVYNLRVHRENRPMVELAGNLARLVLTCAALFAFGHSLLAIAWIAGAVLVGGELAVAFACSRSKQ
ncbi:hypothetical protein [Sinorhizobium meliloti]|uniref:hypothetical protein n=1 Tax=Rhizobium meliloti TaxID=382 RepID=UPI00208FFC14|nr:hypothetical protein [Sinorhizobium meliloti]MCO5965388.1 hypothetical protein [Sinorhizobium meliloti]